MSVVGFLSWLGLRQGDGYPNLDVLLKELRKALPDDESVVLRYIAIVIILLGGGGAFYGRGAGWGGAHYGGLLGLILLILLVLFLTGNLGTVHPVR